MRMFTEQLKKWSRENPSEPDATFFLKCIENSEAIKKAELKKWQRIALGLRILAESQEQEQQQPQGAHKKTGGLD